MLSSMECVCGFEEEEVEHTQTQKEIGWGEECLCRSVCLCGRKCVCVCVHTKCVRQSINLHV